MMATYKYEAVVTDKHGTDIGVIAMSADLDQCLHVAIAPVLDEIGVDRVVVREVGVGPARTHFMRSLGGDAVGGGAQCQH